MAGTAALVLVLSVFNGLEDMFSRLSGRQEPTILVLPANGKYMPVSDTLLNGVKAQSGGVAGYWIEENVLIRHNQLELIGLLRGMNANLMKAAGYDTCLIQGSLPKDDDELAVSSDVASNLGVKPSPFDQITELFVPQPGSISILKPENAFKRQAFTSIGVFAPGSEKSKLLVLSNLTSASYLCGKQGMATGIALFIPDSEMEEISEKLKAFLSKDYLVQDRYQQQEAIYAVFKSEKLWSLLLLSILTGLAALNLIGSLSMLILHKEHDLFILGVLGMPLQAKRQIFGLTGLLISTGGLLIGLLAGATLIYIQQTTGIIRFGSGNELLEAYPVMIRWADIGIVSFVVMSSSLLCLWIPIRKIRV